MVNRVATSRRRVFRGLIHTVFSGMAVLVMLATTGPNASAQSDNTSAQPDNGKGSGFLGPWCAQGDPSKHASISSNEAYFNLTNDNGQTSMGNLINVNQISAPDWQFIIGTLTQDGRRIDWSNGTFWTRCSKGGRGGNSGGGSGRSGGGGSGRGGGSGSGGSGGEGSNRLSLGGIWFSRGNFALECTIIQQGDKLMLRNDRGTQATGMFDGKRHITSNWLGKQIGGTVSQNGNRIDWDTGSYWIRQKVY